MDYTSNQINQMPISAAVIPKVFIKIRLLGQVNNNMNGDNVKSYMKLYATVAVFCKGIILGSDICPIELFDTLFKRSNILANPMRTSKKYYPRKFTHL